jgi:hypothetical protein
MVEIPMTRAVGYAVLSDRGELLVRTVSPTEQGAMVNWLLLGAGIIVPDSLGPTQIKALFERARGNCELVAVDITTRYH